MINDTTPKSAGETHSRMIKIDAAKSIMATTADVKATQATPFRTWRPILDSGSILTLVNYVISCHCSSLRLGTSAQFFARHDLQPTNRAPGQLTALLTLAYYALRAGQ
jgi:hypothetical protein